MAYKYNPFTGNFDRTGIDVLPPEVATQYDTDSGTAIPIGNILQIIGDSVQGTSTSGATNIVTITVDDATTIQKGVLETSTDAESIAGSSSSVAVVPSSLSAKLGTQTVNSVPYGTGTSSAIAWTDPLLDGQVVIGSTLGIPAAAALTAGTGISIVNASNSITVNSLGGGLTWNNITASQMLDVNNGYFCVFPGAVLSLALPAVSAVGDTISIVLDGATSFLITQAAMQQIRVGSSATSAGVGGSLASTAQGDCLTMVCRTANLLWVAISTMGNPTIV